MEHLGLVVCGAPLAARTHEVGAALGELGWAVHAVGTRSALRWLDEAAVLAATGNPVLVEQRRPGEPKRFPVPAHVVLCPATFNTVNKLAAGIADDYAAGFLCEALAARVPMTVVPMVSDRLWGHPVWARNLDLLRGAGVRFADVRSGEVGEPAPTPAQHGEELTAAFVPAWVAHAVGPPPGR